MSDRPYVRVYHADMIADHADVWDDDDLLASWVRLLVAADRSWPAPADIPRSIRVKTLNALTATGLVIRSGEHRFRIKGMDAERNARRNAARTGAASRWHSDGNAETMPNRAEPSRAEPRRLNRDVDTPSRERSPRGEPSEGAA